MCAQMAGQGTGAEATVAVGKERVAGLQPIIGDTGGQGLMMMMMMTIPGQQGEPEGLLQGAPPGPGVVAVALPGQQC